MKVRLLVSTLVATTVMGAMTLPSAASAPNSYALMKLVLADANAYNTVHVVSRSTFSGMKLVQITDAGRTTGWQKNTITTSAGVIHIAIVEDFDGTLYLKGDSAILQELLELPVGPADQLANKWFVLASSNLEYGTVAEGLTVSSVTSELVMNSPVVAQPATKILGVDVEVAKGVTVTTTLNPPTNEVLYFTSAKKPLLVEATQVSSSKAMYSMRFSNWNQTYSLVRPATYTELT